MIIDEIGFLPTTPGGANLFFQLVNARYEKGAIILTSNLGFADWGEMFGDSVIATALLDSPSPSFGSDHHYRTQLQVAGAYEYDSWPISGSYYRPKSTSGHTTIKNSPLFTKNTSLKANIGQITSKTRSSPEKITYQSLEPPSGPNNTQQIP